YSARCGERRHRRCTTVTMRPSRHTVSLGLAAAVYYLLLEWSFSSLAEFDAFYHVGLAKVYTHHGLVRQFPWMSMSILRDRFNDPQLLLHVLTVPLLAVGIDPTVAGKLVAAAAATALAVAFHWFLVRQRARWPIVWTLVWMVA